MSLFDRSGDSGSQIERLGWLDFAPRLKSRTVAHLQGPILSAFGRLPPGSFAARSLALSARRLVGAFLYSLKIEINNRCTMNCRVCYVPRGRQELPLTVLRGLFRSVRSQGVRIEILGGEPLLHPEVLEIIREAKQSARSPLVTLYTNGTLVTPGLAAGLKAAGLDAAIVSLFSHRPEVHDGCTRRDGSWAAAVAGIGRMREVGLKVYTFTPMLRSNVDDLPAIQAYVPDKLRASPLFYQYIPRSADDPLNIRPEEWLEAKRRILSRGREHWAFVRDFFMLTGNACSGGNFVLTVKSDGTVQPCPFVDDVPIGDIFREDIWEIYRTRFRQPLLREFKRLPSECRDCSHRSVCGGGCRASARWSGGYGRRDPKCPGPQSAPITADGLLDRVPTFF